MARECHLWRVVGNTLWSHTACDTGCKLLYLVTLWSLLLLFSSFTQDNACCHHCWHSLVHCGCKLCHFSGHIPQNVQWITQIKIVTKFNCLLPWNRTHYTVIFCKNGISQWFTFQGAFSFSCYFPFVCIKCKVFFISCQVCDKLKMSAALLSFIQGSYRSGKAGKSWVISLAKGKSGKFNLESQGIAHDWVENVPVIEGMLHILSNFKLYTRCVDERKE